MHNYVESRNALPGADMVFNVTELSALAQVLPYLEQTNVYNSINFAFSYQDPNNSTAMMTILTGFICPSDQPDAIPSLGGQTNYMANMGSGIVWQCGDRPECRIAPAQRRLLRQQRHHVRGDHRRAVQHDVLQRAGAGRRQQRDRQPGRRRLLLSRLPPRRPTMP